VAVKAALLSPGVPFRHSEVASSLGLSRSEVHAAVSANRTNLLEFLLHGVRYAYPAQAGGVTRGIPTGYAAPILREHFASTDTLPPVWPHPTGAVRGRSFEPLYSSVPTAAANDPSVYAAMALVDAIRHEPRHA
jgi:hypothetical protein